VWQGVEHFFREGKMAVRVTIAFCAVLICASQLMAQGISARNRAETLNGLNGVHVVVEEIPAIGVENGITASAIKTAVEAKLTERGIPILSLGALTMDPRGPTLLVKIDMGKSEPVFFYNAQVQFFQNVTLTTDASQVQATASASTWQMNQFEVIGRFRLSSIPQQINRLVAAFILDYESQNMPGTRAGGEEAGDGDEDENL